jgi:hypothetical protein
MLFHTVLNNKKETYSNWLQENIKNLGDSTFTIPAEYNYEILEVTDRYVARPDILSHDIYGDALYSDLLCKLNGISNPFELNKGMLLIIPSPDCIMNFMKTVSIEEMDDSIINVKPTPKTKKERRQPNEAIVGDQRFKIDRTQGIIIY